MENKPIRRAERVGYTVATLTILVGFVLVVTLVLVGVVLVYFG